MDILNLLKRYLGGYLVVEHNCIKCKTRKRLHDREYQKKHKKQLCIYYKKWLKENELNLIKHRIRHQIYKAVTRRLKGSKGKKNHKYNIDYDAISKHLGKKPEGNYHIDHIIPLNLYSLATLEEAFSPKNLRWLSAEENLKRSKHG